MTEENATENIQEFCTFSGFSRWIHIEFAFFVIDSETKSKSLSSPNGVGISSKCCGQFQPIRWLSHEIKKSTEFIRDESYLFYCTVYWEPIAKLPMSNAMTLNGQDSWLWSLMKSVFLEITWESCHDFWTFIVPQKICKSIAKKKYFFSSGFWEFGNSFEKNIAYFWLVWIFHRILCRFEWICDYLSFASKKCFWWILTLKFARFV